MGQQASSIPLPDKCIEQLATIVPVVDGVEDDGAVEQAGSHHLFAFSMLLDFLKPLDRFLADVVDPVGGPFGQLRMVLRLPCSPGGAQRCALAIELDLALCQVHEKRRALPVADYLVDFSDHIRRIRDHHSLTWHKFYASRSEEHTPATVPQRKPAWYTRKEPHDIQPQAS